jgi:hypothetical protein
VPFCPEEAEYSAHFLRRKAVKLNIGLYLYYW